MAFRETENFNLKTCNLTNTHSDQTKQTVKIEDFWQNNDLKLVNYMKIEKVKIQEPRSRQTKSNILTA